MKNSRYFPFERNKYFYGKLLSVDDFELEQRYNNNKRRMTNRFLQGAGVAAGLHVVRLDEKTISLERGFALDGLGREIVVDMPVIRKLSMLEGYEDCVEGGSQDYVYLCLDYEEEETGAVHNIAGSAMISGEEQAFNKIKEAYRLYLTDIAPKQENPDKSALYEQSCVLYASGGVRIRLAMPKYVSTGTAFQIRVEIENTTKRYLEFSFDLGLECMDQEGRSGFTVNFNEAQYEKKGNYMLAYQVTAADLPGADAAVRLQENSVQLYLNKEPHSFYGNSVTFPVQIILGDIRNQVIADYYRTAMDQIVNPDQTERLYLAKIYLLRTYNEGEDTCLIDQVENLPFHQYILNQNLSFALHQLAVDGYASGGTLRTHPQQGRAGSPREQQEQGVLLAQGSYWLDLGGGGERGDRFIGEEVPHGLGLGPAVVIAGLEDEDGIVTYGSSEIFPDMDLLLELSVRVYPEKGTFQIAGRLREQVIKNGVSVHWTAMMHAEEKKTKKMTRKIFIKPGILELAARESHYLEAVCINMDDKTVEWSVQEHGGSISPNGMYTAPNMPGVYEVVVQSTAYPDVRASVFVVVREA